MKYKNILRGGKYIHYILQNFFINDIFFINDRSSYDERKITTVAFSYE
jgi:hypothetical protein